jgi:hypothetical protein
MTKVAERNGFVAVQLNTEIRNVGQVRAHLIGYAVWVYGLRIAPLRQPQGPNGDFRKLNLDGAFYRKSPRTPVFGYGFVTALGDPTTGTDALLQPGDDIKSQDVFFVPMHRFDLLEAWINSRYTKNDEHVIPTKLVINRHNLPTFVGSQRDNFDFFSGVSRISIM